MNHPTPTIHDDNDDEKQDFPVILEEAEEAVYGRDGDYGTPEDNFATIAAFWNEYLMAGGCEDPNITPKDVAQMMVLLKVSRHSNGSYNRDNDCDIAGYAESSARIAKGQRNP
jgi:hypothetical protein